MKRAEVGRFRVLLDDCGEGAVVIDHNNKEVGYTPRLKLEPGELADLLVAIDGVSNDLPPRKPNEPRLNAIREILREVQHKLYAVGVRYRLEMHVEHHDLHALAHEAGQDKLEHLRPDTTAIDLNGPYIRLVARRGARV